MFLRWKLDKNGNKMPDAKCPKCKSDAFNSYTCLKCDTCHWCWDGEGDGWYDEEKEVKDVKVEPSTYFHEKNHKWKWMPFSKREAEGKKMDKTVKQSHILHSLLNELMKSDLEFAVKIISKKYKLKPSFVNEKIKLLVQNTFVHLFCELINKKRKDHRLLKEFLLRIGKDAGYIKLLYEIFGDYNKRDDYIGMAKTETESHFYIQLQSELDINKLDDEGEAKFFLIYQKIFASCESIVNDIDKTAEKLILRNGEWDYKQ